MKILQPDIVPVGDGKYVLRERYYLSLLNIFNKYRIGIYILPGFEYDGASVPRIAQFLTGISSDGLHRAAALVHDYLYRNHKISIYTQKDNGSSWNHASRKFSRSEADEIFYRIMLESGVPTVRAKLMYAAVRAFGWRHW